MDKNHTVKSIKKAIRMAFAIEKVIKISNAIDDISDGIEEIEQSFGRNRNKEHGKQCSTYSKK